MARDEALERYRENLTRGRADPGLGAEGDGNGGNNEGGDQIMSIYDGDTRTEYRWCNGEHQSTGGPGGDSWTNGPSGEYSTRVPGRDS